jgi:hypothetical protein
MSSKSAIGNEVSGVETVERQEIDADGFAVVDEVAVREANQRPTVEMEIQGKVDTNHPDGRMVGLTLEAEERMQAREWEIERTVERFDRRSDSDREARTRTVVREQHIEQRRVFEERAAAVDSWEDPELADAREQVSKTELGWVNEEATRLSGMLSGWSRAAISRRLAERVVDGVSKTAAVVGVFEELQTDAGQVLPIAALEDVPVKEVSIEGVVRTLWTPTSSAIQQVGLIEDESGTTKFTVWTRSDQSVVEEGERVVLRNVAKSWYEGRVSVALTGQSSISFPKREAWWAE